MPYMVYFNFYEKKKTEYPYVSGTEMLRNFLKVTKLTGRGAGTNAHKDSSKVHAICIEFPVTATPWKKLSAQGITRGWQFLRGRAPRKEETWMYQAK